jgi:hypothetical protein
MFGQAHPATITILPHSLIFNDEKNQKIEVEIPRTAVDHLEVLNKASYQETVKGLFSQLKQKPKEVVLLVSDDVVFVNGTQNEETFKENVPLNPAATDFLRVASVDRVQLFAVHRFLLSAIREVCVQERIECSVAAPAALYPSEANFFQTKSIPVIEEARPTLAHRNRTFSLLLFLFLMLFGGVVLYFLYMRAMEPVALPVETLQPATTFQQTPGVSDQVVPPAIRLERDRVNMAVELVSPIQNLTQANELKDRLLELSYGVVNVVSTTSAVPAMTEVEFAVPVSDEIFQELLTEISTDFREVRTFDATNSASSEVRVILGQRK